MQTYGSAATRRHCDPVNFLMLGGRGGVVGEKRLNCADINFPALHLTPASFGAENLSLCTAGVIYSPQGGNVFSQFGTHAQDEKKKTKGSDTSDKSASVLIIWKMFGQVSSGAAVWGTKRRMGRKSILCRNTAEEVWSTGGVDVPGPLRFCALNKSGPSEPQAGKAN